MSSRNQVLSNNTNSFPNNNSGQITPADLRDFNADFIDSVRFLDEPIPLATTASYAVNAGSASFATNAASAASATSASYASQAQNAVNATNATNATNAQTAATATSASYALTASFALNGGGGTVDTGSLVTTASFNAFSSSVDSQLTALENFSSSLDATFATDAQLNAFTASTNTFTSSIQTQVNALQAATSSYVTNAQTSSMSVLSASFATTASYASTAASALNASDILVYAKNSSGAQIDKGKLVLITGAVGDNPLISLADYSSEATSAGTLGFVTTNIPNDSFGYVMTEGTFIGLNTLGYTAGQVAYLGASGSITGSQPIAPLQAVRVGEILRVQSNNGSIYARIDNGYELEELHNVAYTGTPSTGQALVVSGSLWTNGNPATASFAQTIASGLNISASGLTVANNANVLGNLTVNGTASFGYLQTVTGSAVIVNEEFIILNAATPTAPYAGIKVYDTGSAGTASFQWNGNTDNWIVVEETGLSAGILTGPTGSLGSEVFPTNNTILKGTGHHTVGNSNITDNGSIVSINSNTQITGSLGVSAGITANLTGTASYATYAVNAGDASTATSASFASTASFVQNAQTASYVLNAVSASYADNATSASYSLNASQATSASFATTASFAQTAVSASWAPTVAAFPFTGSAQITGSLGVTGSIFGKPQYITTERSFPILEAQDDFSVGGNVILTRTQLAISTGSVAITGSNNFIALSNGAGNTFVNNGGASIIRGINSIILGNSVPTITGSNGSGYNRTGPLFSNSINLGSLALTDNRPTPLTTFYTNTNTIVNGLVAATISTGSLGINNSNINASLVLNVTGSNGAAKAILNSTIGGTARIDFASSGSMSLQNGVIAGSALTASLVDGASSMLGVIMLGNGLSASGSLGTTATGGSTYVGRWNALDSTALSANTAFAVGAGTSNTVRSTPLHVSASGLTTISSLSATGSLLGTASFANNATSASYALTASFALNGGGGGVTFPYTGSAVITGSLVVTGSTRGNIVTVTATSATASLDLNEGNAFLFTISGSNLLNITNYPTGSNQKFSLMVATSAVSSSINFGSGFVFPSGTSYTPTTTSGSIDILTFETYTY